MIRPSDQFRDQVDRSFRAYAENMDGGGMTCKFCGHLFGKRTSISRIKLHLSGVTAVVLRFVNMFQKKFKMQPVQQLMALQKKKLKTVAGSSNNEVANAISASAQE